MAEESIVDFVTLLAINDRQKKRSFKKLSRLSIKKKCKFDIFAMKSSASFRITSKSSNISPKASKGSFNPPPSSGTSITGISFNSNSSDSQTCAFVPIPPDYLRQPLEDFDSPQTDVSHIISLYISLMRSLS